VWTVCAPEANQYVIRLAQRDRSAWGVILWRGYRHSANQYVLLAARTPVSVWTGRMAPEQPVSPAQSVQGGVPRQLAARNVPKVRSASPLRRRGYSYVGILAHNRFNRKLNFL
jgi:hypothetical protein